MNREHSESDTRLTRSIINLQDRYSGSIMDVRTRKIINTTAAAPQYPPQKKMELHRTFSQGNSRRLFSVSCFGLESLLLLICLTVSLLILPLILPPLPPPPFLLLLLPIGILALLMILAFMPSNARDIAYTYA